MDELLDKEKFDMGSLHFPFKRVRTVNSFMASNAINVYIIKLYLPSSVNLFPRMSSTWDVIYEALPV